MPFYIYRHIRPDTNEVFYIGKGNNLDKRKSEYRRAFETIKRSEFWKSIVDKNNGNYIVEIMFHCDTDAEASCKEIEFISLYGRRDLGKGTLANLTDGGDGSLGVVVSESTRQKKREIGSPMQGKKHTEISKKKQSEAAKMRLVNNFKGKKHKEETILRLKELAKNRKPRNLKKVIDINTNVIYASAKEAAISLGLNILTVRDKLRGDKKNNTTLRYA